MQHVAWLRKPTQTCKICVHCTHRVKATNDKMAFNYRKLSAVVRYRTSTCQIWHAAKFKSEDKSHQTIIDRPTSKEMTHVVHRLVTSATIDHLQLHVSVTTIAAHIVLLWLPKKRLCRSLAPTNCLPVVTRSKASVRSLWTFSSITLCRCFWVIDDLR